MQESSSVVSQSQTQNDGNRCSSHHRFELAITSLTEGYKELYGLLVGTARDPGVLELLRKIENRLDVMQDEQESRDERVETRFWVVFKTLTPWVLGLLAVYLGVN